jgi:ABC-type sugar transport system substrate-binding protein
MIHRIRTFSRRSLAAMAAAVLLAGAATASAASAATSSQAQASSGQTNYIYYSDSSLGEAVGHATEGCGEPWTLQWGTVTSHVRIKVLVCPI